MKKIILLALGSFAFFNSQAQIDKLKSGSNAIQKANTNITTNQILQKKYAKGTVGDLLQNNPDVFNQLTPEEIAKLGKLLDAPATDIKKNRFSDAFRIMKPKWWFDLFANVTINDFGVYSPCAIAISNKGKVAISTHEGDETIGKVFVWSNFISFKDGKRPAYNFDILDPEGLAFDSKEGLFISSTYQGQINYINNFNFQPSVTYYIDKSNNHNTALNWNPRGLAVDANDNLYVMCENVHRSGIVSAVVKVSNAQTVNPTRLPLEITNQDQNHALGLAIKNNILVTAGYGSQTLNVYDITNNSVSKRNIVHKDYSNTMDVALDEPYNGITYAYYNNEGGYLVKWNIADTVNDNATSVNIGSNTNWGVAIYGNYIISANAVNHKIVIKDKTTDFR